MAGVFVSLDVLAIALVLMAWFGVRAGGARVPLFYVEPTSIAVVPIRKMFAGVGVWCSWLLAVGCRHLVVWWWDVAIRSVVVSGSIGGWCVASSSTLVSLVPASSSCIAAIAASIVARLVGRLHVMRGWHVCRDDLCLVVNGMHVVGRWGHGRWHHLHLLGVCEHRHLLGQLCDFAVRLESWSLVAWADALFVIWRLARLA
jgi:hypothetical protein